MNLSRWTSPSILILLVVGCGGKTMTDAERLRAELCPPVNAVHEFDELPLKGSDAEVLNFQNIRATVNAACMTCHQVPGQSGGFSYSDTYLGQQIAINGVSKWYPGFYESAEKMRDYIFHADEKKRMPPKDKRERNPEAFLEIGRQLELWIKAGKPNGSFQAGKLPEKRRGKFRPVKPKSTSDIGDCVPTSKAVGFDYEADRHFASAKTLPKYLVDTDLFTLDPLALAKHGTFAYNVEYPLWADNAEKGRWIHVPMKEEGGKLVRQSIVYNAVTGQFDIPDGTRFYKSFYRAVNLPNGRVRMRRMETRLIVARRPWQESLFGTYQWDDTEQVASLVEAPYRDGTPFRDLFFDVVTDEEKNTVKPYMIPGRQRCVDCHMGSPTRNFVLGFTPLQINKRPLGGAGRTDRVEEHDLDQVRRFVGYGLISGLSSARDLPRLEDAGSSRPNNVHEIRANGYMVGNCFHCHNADGLAKESGVDLTLGPGDIFGFNTQRRSVQITTRKLVHQNGDLAASHIWRKVSDDSVKLGGSSQMPMHTPGRADCKVLTVVGRWIRSFESPSAANMFKPPCKKENPLGLIDTDFTWPSNDVYTPRRADWADPVAGMPPRYREIQLTPGLEAAIQTEFPVGYWLENPNCSFPAVDLPEAERRPWMMEGDEPFRPFGEVYSTTPGSYFFRNTCAKCHGPGADGRSALATSILNWSGGSVRVANLIEGMFGAQGEHLKTFIQGDRDYSGNYLIWMAMEGTRVRFPPEVASTMGKHGGQMLNGIREKCLSQISPQKKSSPRYEDHEIYNRVCFLENLAPGHPDLAFDPATGKPIYPDKVEAWLDRGAWNAGFAIYGFLKDAGQGRWRPGPDQCEKVYPKMKE